MKFLTQLIISALAVIITSLILPGVHIDSPLTGVIVAAVLAVLNAIIKPILIILTIPITIFTLGLFLLVINAGLIMTASELVHGFSVPYYIWGGTYDSLVQQGFQVIRYDEFGRGYSDRPNVTYDPVLYRKQLFDLITSLKLKTPVSLAGLSFGGAVVSDFAVHYPQLIDKVILIDPVYPFGKINVPVLIADYKMALDHEKQASGQLEDFKYPEKFPDWVDRYKVQMQYKGFRHALISTRNNYSQDSIVSNYHKLGDLHKKILLIWGKEDRTVLFHYSDSLRKILPADFFPVDDAGHLPHLEKPFLVNQKIISFLKE